MKKTLKVFLSILLAMIFVMGVTPLTVSAARKSSTPVKVVTTSNTKKTTAKTKTTTTKKTTSKSKKASTTAKKRIIPEGVTNFRKNPEKGNNVLFKWYEKDTPSTGVEVLEEKVKSGTLWYRISLTKGNKKYSGWVDSNAVTVVYPTSKLDDSTKKASTTTSSKKTSKTTTKKTTSKKKSTNNVVFEATYFTKFVGGSKGRNININQACKDLDGIIIPPGEEFNWFEDMPDTTKENGYAKARVISNGKYVQGYGGGICQVCSTLYNSCLIAKDYVKVTVRKPHGKKVSYVPEGMDATICRGSKLNFCFKNTSEYYIVVNAKTGGGKLTVTLTGYKNKPKK